MRYNSQYIYIGLGANQRSLSYRSIPNILNSVKKRLPKIGLRVIKTSNNWASFPVPYSQIPVFINKVIICISLKNETNPYFLLKDIKKLEKKMGRKYNYRSISRVIDIDILDFGGIISNKDIILPHPRIRSRKFVLKPLLTVDKNWKHPICNSRVDILNFKNKSKEYLKEQL